MRHILLIFSIAICFITNSIAQGSYPKIGCKDANLLVQITELKGNLIKQGFEVVNDGMLSMDSREDFPVIVRMQAGTYYQIVFIANNACKRMNLDLYGTNKEILIQKEQQPLGQSSNIISFSFTPNSSGDYTFILNQSMKSELLKFKSKQSVCGSFCILRLKKTN